MSFTLSATTACLCKKLPQNALSGSLKRELYPDYQSCDGSVIMPEVEKLALSDFDNLRSLMFAAMRISPDALLCKIEFKINACYMYRDVPKYPAPCANEKSILKGAYIQ